MENALLFVMWLVGVLCIIAILRRPVYANVPAQGLVVVGCWGYVFMELLSAYTNAPPAVREASRATFELAAWLGILAAVATIAFGRKPPKG